MTEEQAQEEKTLTEIPEDGWEDIHDGQKVRLKMPMGTIIEDEIIGLPLEGGKMLYGPSQELGMILARAEYAMAAQFAAAEWAAKLEKMADERNPSGKHQTRRVCRSLNLAGQGGLGYT